MDSQNDWNINYQVDNHKRTNCISEPVSSKIAVIGDSFVFGSGVENCMDFVSILNKKNDQYTFENYGVIGVGINEYIMVLRDFIDDSYEEVIILFYGNDISGFENFQNRSFTGKFADNSSLLALLRKFKRSILIKNTLNKEENESDKNKKYNNVVEVIKNNDSYFYDTVFPSEFEKNKFENYFEILDKTVTKKNIKKVHIAVVPNGENLSKPLMSFIEENGGKTADYGVKSDSYLFIKELAQRFNYEFIETFDQFSSESERYYFKDDLHWNSHGHILMADIILKRYKK